jgi:glutamyl-tRNA synthetase
VLNYLALLGWAPADGKEFLPVAELIARFGLDRVNRSPAKFDVKKLEALHFEHTRIMEPARFVERGVAALSRAGIQTSGFAPEYIAAALETAREKGKLFKDLPAFVDFYFAPDDAVPVEAETRAKALSAAARMPLERLAAAFGAIEEFKAAPLEAALKALAAELGVKVGALVQPVRAACTGKSVGPSLYHLLEVLGRERVQRRFAAALSQVPPA